MAAPPSAIDQKPRTNRLAVTLAQRVVVVASPGIKLRPGSLHPVERGPCDTLTVPFGPNRQRRGEPNGIHVQTRARRRTPADPPVLQTAVPNWSPGDTIPLGADRTLRVIETRFVDDDPVLVVELD
jgi:hypothetical protein